MSGILAFLELNKSRKQIEKWNGENSKTDRISRELRSHVDDLNEVLSAKDSQLAVLKVRLEEADQLLKARTEAIDMLQNERNRFQLLSWHACFSLDTNFQMRNNTSKRDGTLDGSKDFSSELSH